MRKEDGSVTMGSARASDSSGETLKGSETKLGMTRSASSPKLSSESDNKVIYTWKHHTYTYKD